MTGGHQSVGKGCGGWPGLASDILTLGGLGLFAWAGPAQAQATFCDRTPAVRDAILGQIDSTTACEDVSVTDLNGITEPLSLGSQSLSRLQKDDFADLSNLQQLDLHKNDLRSLPADIFAGLSNLLRLRLEDNSLRSLDADIFTGLSSLKYLFLDGNALRSLDADIFAGPSSLEWLYLDNNSLRNLDADIFADLSNLRFLYLYNNSLGSLPADIFNDLSSLEWLYLYNNSLRSLDADIFAGLSNLQQLYLTGNGLECLPRSVPWSRVADGDLTLDVDLPDCFEVSLSVMPTEVEKGNGGESITVTATLSAGERATSVATEVTISVAADTATEDDFTAVDPFTITIPSGSESRTGTFTLTATADAVAEPGGGTVLVSGTSTVSSYSAEVSSATVTIQDAPGVSVTPPTLTVTVSENSSGVYTLVLDTRPAGPVTISPTSGDSGALTVLPASLTFTAANWNTARTVTVTGMDDGDGDDETVTVSHGVSGYATLTAAAAMTVTVTDDDTPGVSVERTSMSPVEGETASYTLTLSTQPAGPVTITPTSSGDSGALSVSPTSLTFTPSDWDTARTVTVTAVDDDNTANETITISHSVSGYTTVTSADAVTVTVTDDDTPGVSVQPPGLSTDESGTASYTVKLITQPTGPATITPISGDSGAVSVSPTSLTFTPSDWDAARTVTVTGVDDDDANDETVTISHSVRGYGAVTTAAAVTVSVTDSDTAGVTVEPPSVNLNEGGTASYTVTLNTQPVGPVTITPTSSGDSGAVSVSSARLAFTPSNWDTPRTVSVTGMEDADTDAETVTVSHSVSGYGSVTAAAVTVSVMDNDTAGVMVEPPSVNLNEGGTASYTVTLNTQPVGNMTITPTSGDSGAVSVSSASLTFSPSNWDTARTVTVTGVVDGDGASEAVTISHSVSGYDTLTAAPAVTVSVMDNDTAGVSVEPPSVDLNEGGTASYTVTLNTQPVGNVTITPTSGDSGAVSVSSASLTFTPSDWDTARTVSMTGVQDDDDNNETVTISHSVSGYGSVTANSVTVSVTDNDTAGVSVEPTSLSPTEGGTLTYNVTLVTQPGGPVTITPGSSDSGAVSVSPASLTFTPSNWDTPRTVSVTGVVDADTDAETATISHSVSGYGSVTTNSVTVSVTDNDTAGVSVEPTSLSPTEGGTLTYNVTLVTQPGGPVTITPSSGDSGALSVSPVGLTFTPSNWDTPQAVSVTGVEDADTDAETVTISHSVSGYDSVTAAPAVMVSVTDNDTAGGSVDTVQPGVSVQATTLTVREASSGVYTLLLDTPPPGAVTITPSSSDSGAVSVSSASLTFTPSNWDTPQAVSVTGVQDGDDNNETVTISHGVSGYDAVTVAAAVTVTVTDDDTTQDDNDEARAAKEEAEAVLDEVVLPEVMQQLTARTTEVITSRLNTIASGSLGDPLTLSLEEVLADTIAALHGEREHLKNGSLEWRQAVSGRNFAFPLSGLNLTQGESASAQEHPFSSLAVWGGADYSSYGNTIERTDVDGSGFSGVIGMDLQPTPRLVSGLALTSSRWGLDYETDAPTKGTYEIGITMLHPYLNWLATDQLSLWATFGYGRGAVDHNPEGDAATTRTDGLTSWAGGVRFEVLPGADPLTGEGSPFALALKVDGAASSFLETQVQLVRLAAEVSRSFTVESGLLTTALDLGWSIRSVSGQEDPDGLQQRVADKKDGGGAELAGSLNWLSRDGSVSATVDTRVLLGGGDRREWGMGGQLRFAPSRRAGEGPSLTLQPSFGMTDTRLDELWSLSGNSDPAIGNDLPGGRLDAQLAYGFRHGNALLTPYTELTWEEAASIYGAGLRYHRNASLELDLKGTHRNRANGNTENRFSLDVRSRL